MTRTPEQDIAACRAFALQMQPYAISRTLNDAADQIERLALAAAASGGDVEQAPGEASQSGPNASEGNAQKYKP